MSVFDDPETINFALQIELALDAGGWSERPWKNSSGIAFKRPNKHDLGLNLLIGVFVQADEGRISDFGHPVVSLANAFKKAGFAALSQIGKMPDNMDSDVIIIQVGKKNP